MKGFAIIIIFAVIISYTSFALPECDYKVEVLTNGTEFEKGNVKWSMKAAKIEGPATNITGTAEIVDWNDNAVKSYRPWSNEQISRQKTSNEYSPNLKEDGQYRIISRIDVLCNDSDSGNNVDIKIIKIKTKINESAKAIDKTVLAPEVGRTITNPENNKSKKAPVDNANDESAELPKDETARQSSKGFDNEILLTSGNLIKNDERRTSNAIREPEIFYESSSQKAKNLIIFFILGFSILLNIVLIWKR